MLLTLALLAAASTSALNQRFGPQLPPVVPVEAAQAWEVDLDQDPVAAPHTFMPSPGQALILLALEHVIEVRRAEDGALVWRRDDRDGAGLATAGPVPTPRGPAFGWCGGVEDGGWRCEFLSAADGTTLGELALAAAPVAPPLAVRRDAVSFADWYVALADRVIAFDSTASVTRIFLVPDAVRSAPIEVAGGLAVIASPQRRFVAIAAPARRQSPIKLEIDSVVTAGDWLYGLAENRFSAWRCRRDRRRAGLGCSLAWRQTLAGAVTAPALLDEGRVFVPAWDTFLYAFRASNGDLLWRLPTGHRLASTPLVWDDLVAVEPANTATVKFYRAEDGAEAGQLAASAEETFIAGIARAGDRLLLVSTQLPRPTPVLRAYRVTRKPPPPPGAPSSTAPPPASVPPPAGG